MARSIMRVALPAALLCLLAANIASGECSSFQLCMALISQQSALIHVKLLTG
jgi:hypothetical protein